MRSMADAVERTALVTGGSRGVGRGVALALAEAGWRVVVTGRGDDGRPSEALRAVAGEVDERGGHGVAIACDHRDDSAIAALFEQVDEIGLLDLLVNNVWAGPGLESMFKPFWERPVSDWNLLVGLGLRAHYVASHQAAPRMIERGHGLIINISSFGARGRLHSVAYGVSKVGLDKMAADMAVDLADTGVTTLSLWPGLVRTETLLSAGVEEIEGFPVAEAETPEFVGRVIRALAEDPATARRSGHTLVATEVAEEYGILDERGQRPRSHRQAFGGGPLFPPPTDVD
jgi:NAD(P)-dependent dehydrogenase (short-subunit alcohol dehydrogenase family)